MEFRIVGNKSREIRPRKKVDIEVLKVTNCSLKSFKICFLYFKKCYKNTSFVKQEIKT